MKKSIALIIVFLMAFSSMTLTAFGASYGEPSVSVSSGYSGTLNLAISDADAAHQVTMLAAPAGTEDLSDTTIKYINQVTGTSSFTHNFTLGNDAKPGLYTIKVGGSDISAPKTVNFETKVAAPAITAAAGNPTTVSKNGSSVFTFDIAADENTTLFAAGVGKEGAEGTKGAFVTIAGTKYNVAVVSSTGTQVAVNLGNGALSAVDNGSISAALNIESVGFTDATANLSFTLEGEGGVVIIPGTDSLGLEGYSIVTVDVPVGFNVAEQNIVIKGVPAFYSPVRNKFIAAVEGSVSESDVTVANGAVSAANTLYYGVLVSDGAETPRSGDISASFTFYLDRDAAGFTVKQKLALDIRGAGDFKFSDLNSIISKSLKPETFVFEVEKN